MRRKEQRGGRSSEDGEEGATRRLENKMKKLLKDASLASLGLVNRRRVVPFRVYQKYRNHRRYIKIKRIPRK